MLASIYLLILYHQSGECSIIDQLRSFTVNKIFDFVRLPANTNTKSSIELDFVSRFYRYAGVDMSYFTLLNLTLLKEISSLFQITSVFQSRL